MKFILKIVKILRLITNLPFKVLILVGDFYSIFLKILDKRNHDSFWPETMQKSIDKNTSKEIEIMQNPKKIIKFYCPTQISSYRAKTFFTKEPETLKWMDEFGSNKKCLFDIGANAGIYSVYYAKKYDSKVYAFEPSYKNLNLLSQNIKLNGLEKNICLIPNPISNKFYVSDFVQFDPSAGSASATFNGAQEKGEILQKSKSHEKQKIFNYKTLGLSIDYLVEHELIRPPELIKIDVDGNELDIINGLNKTISNVNELTILIETREKTHQHIEEKFVNLGLQKINQIKDNSIWRK